AAGPGDDHRGAPRGAAGLRGGAGQPPPQAGTGLRAAVLPLRRAGGLRRVPGPAAAPDAHDRVAAAQPPPRLHEARGGGPGRLRRPLRRGDGALGRPPRRARRALPGPGPLRGLPRLPDPLLPPPERPGGDAPPRAAHHPAGPPRLPGGRPGDAPAHRREGRAPGDRRGDALRRPLARAEPRAPRRRAPGRGSPPVPVAADPRRTPGPRRGRGVAAAPRGSPSLLLVLRTGRTGLVRLVRPR